MSTRNRIRVDVAVVGGGIAGLWLLNLLRARGFSAVLIERSAFGDGQTIRSQGMIHGGMKYALGGALTGASEAIAAMPARWRSCLDGRGELDLRGVRVLSDRYYLWSANDSTLGQLTGFFASKMLRGRVRRLQRGAWPTAFDSPQFHGVVYELDDLVLDTPSLLEHLAYAQRDFTLRADVRPEHLVRRRDGCLDAIALQDYDIAAERYVFAAGAGNETLVQSLAPAVSMQRRPLHQLIVRAPNLPPLFAHCIERLVGTEPRLTVTSHTDAHAQRIWYIGGQIATDGAGRGDAQQADHARAELAECLPWIDLAGARFESLRVDRAEPARHGGRRPDEAYVATSANVMICWPTKLALAPDLGDKVIAALSIEPAHPCSETATELPRLRVAGSPWDR
jgi:glycine/D-amino acid oxidase-like deaminating enzyme